MNSRALANGAVNRRVLKPAAVIARSIAPDAVSAAAIAPGSVYGGALGTETLPRFAVLAKPCSALASPLPPRATAK